MADLERTIQLIFGADNRISPVISEIDQSLGRIDDIALTIAAPLADVAEKILGVKAALITLGVTIGALAFNEAVQLESALADLQKQLGDTDPPIEELEKDIRILSGQFGISSVELINATANIKQAGFDAAGAFDILRASINLQIAGGLDAANATDVLIRSINGFKVEASDAADIVEVLNAGSNAYATSTQELANGFSNLSPIANAFNLTFTDTADLLIGTIQVFGSGTEAANALVTGLTSLLKPTKDAGTAIQDLGVKLFDANDTTRSARDFVFEFAKSFGTLNDAQQIQIATTIFGSEQSVKLTEAFNAIGRSTVDVAEAMGRVSSVQDEVNVRLGTTESVIARTIVAFQNLGQTIGKEYRDELKGVIDATGDFAQALDKAIADGALDELFDLLEPQFKALETLIRDVAKNLPKALEGIDFSNVVAAFDRLGIEVSGIFKGLFGDIDVSTVEGLQSALQGVADAFAGLTNITAGIVQAFRPFAEAIGEAVRNLAELDAESQQSLGRVIGIAKTLIDFGLEIGLAFVAIAESGIEMARVMDTVFGGIGVLINGAQIGFQELAGNILLTFANIAEINAAISFGALSDKFTELATNLRGTAEIIGEDVARNYAELAEAQDQVTGAFDSANPKYLEAQSRLKGLETNLVSTKSAMQGLGESFDDPTRKAGEFADTYQDVHQSITDAFIDKLAEDNKGLAASFGGLNTILAENKKAQEAVSDEARGYRVVIDELTGKIVGYEQVGGKLATSFDKSGEAAKKATEESEQFELKLEEIASNERIKLIEAKVSLDIAELEADTKRIEAAFNSINTSIQSTGDVLDSSLSALTDLASSEFGGRFTEQFRILRDQIKAENRLREQSFDLQRELNQAVVDNLRAKSEALRRGDALIKIDGTGLEPELEAFMFKILDRIQVVANSNLQEFLLAVDAPA